MLSKIIEELHAASPETRLQAVYILQMVEETRALDALRQQFAIEIEPAIKQAIHQAGQMIFAAKKNGYSVVNTIFEYFGINRELANSQPKEEEELEKRLQYQLERDLQQMKMNSLGGQALGIALSGAFIGPMGIVSQAMGSVMDAGTAQTRDTISTRRTPATMPSTMNISIWIRRLQTGATPQERVKAAQELVSLYNPDALPFLATAFVNELNPDARTAIQKSGKLLYNSVEYWDMQQDGSLEQEIHRRRWQE